MWLQKKPKESSQTSPKMHARVLEDVGRLFPPICLIIMLEIHMMSAKKRSQVPILVQEKKTSSVYHGFSFFFF